MNTLFFTTTITTTTLLAAGADLSKLTWLVGIVIYVVLGLVALWGAFCVVMVWRRVAHTRFRDEQAQDEFLDAIEESLDAGDFDRVAEICEGDGRAMPQLALLAVNNRDLGYSKVRHLVADRFQRDVLADMEFRLSWVNTVIKTAPMVGLLGTVIGMMGAFLTLSEGAPETLKMAGDISLALITTACGLAIAIPLVLATASINVRIRKMEDLVGVGLLRLFESFKIALSAESKRLSSSATPSSATPSPAAPNAAATAAGS